MSWDLQANFSQTGPVWSRVCLERLILNPLITKKLQCGKCVDILLRENPCWVLTLLGYFLYTGTFSVKGNRWVPRVHRIIPEQMSSWNHRNCLILFDYSHTKLLFLLYNISSSAKLAVQLVVWFLLLLGPRGEWCHNLIIFACLFYVLF